MKSTLTAVFLGVLVATISGCGSGYVVTPGRLAIQTGDQDSRDRALKDVSRVLVSEGFEDLGKYDEMIDLISHGSMDAITKNRELDRLHREYNYLDGSRNLSATASDYVSVDKSTVQLRYEAPFKSFIELAIYESRPGGSSRRGQVLFKKIFLKLQSIHEGMVVLINDPPPTDEAEYRRVTIVNTVGSIVACLIALSLSLVAIGIPIYLIVKRMRLPMAAKRISFSILCAWLVTPMPVPAALIEIPVPNLFLFPWNDVSYYRHRGAFFVTSFIATLVVCAFLSMYKFRERPENRGVEA